MKMEHKAIIDRARLLDLSPSELAHELTAHDLVEAGLFELKNLHSPYNRLNEGQQQEVIERLTEAVNDAVRKAIAIISSRHVTTIPMMMKEVKFNSKQLTLTSIVDAKDPNRHDLIDSAGHLCLLVMAPDDYNEGMDFIQPDRDQPELPMHVSDLTGSLFDRNGRATTTGPGPDEPDGENYTPLTDPFYERAVTFVVTSRRATASSVQRELDIGFNRAATLLEAMEQNGVVSGIDHTGAREVLIEDPEFAEVDDAVDATFMPDGKEFGEFTYEDAAQIVVLHAKTVDVAYLQRRLAIDTDQATSLLLRLVDNEVIQLETEAELSIDNTYKVIAELANLNLE